MKQSSITFLVIFSLLITLLNAYVDDHSKHGRKLIHVHSVHASSNTGATLTITDFEKGGDRGRPSKCNGVYHSNDLLLVSLSTRWYNDGKNCYKGVSINYNGTNVTAVVIDGCNHEDEGYCTDDVVAASKAVWQGLQVSESEWGDKIQVTWSFLD